MTKREILAEIGELEDQKMAIDDRIASLEYDIDSENYDPEPDDEDDWGDL
jgi:hypothetical protein